MSIVDLIDQAIDDCAVSDDAVRYNATDPPPGRFWPGVEVTAADINLNWQPDRDAIGRYLAAFLNPDHNGIATFTFTWDCTPLHTTTWLSWFPDRHRRRTDPAKRRRLRRLHTAHPARWRKP